MPLERQLLTDLYQRNGVGADTRRCAEVVERALHVVVACAEQTLGRTTLDALMHCALDRAVARYPGIEVVGSSAGGLSFVDLKEQAGELDGRVVQEGLEFLLVHFVELLGRVSDGVLLAEIKTALAEMTISG